MNTIKNIANEKVISYSEQYKQFCKEQEGIKAQNCSTKRVELCNTLKSEIDPLIGSFTGKIDAGKVIGGACLWGYPGPFAKTLLFNRDSIIVIDSAGNSYDYLSIAQNIGSLERVLNVLKNKGI